MFMVKYLAAFVLGLFIGWISFSPEEKPEQVAEPEVMPVTGVSRSPLFRAAAGARSTPNSKELN